MRNLMIFTLVLARFVQATTFAPVSIKDQIKQSNGVVQGEVVAINSEKDPELGIVTKVFIKADKWMDAKVNQGHIELYYPGGEVQGEGHLVHGAPEFKQGEKVVVFTNSHGGKSWIQNLGLGKFSIKRVGRSHIIVNQIFPNMPNVGQMPLSSFVELAKNIKGKSFERRFKDKYERAAEKESTARYQKLRGSRSIASTPQNPHEKPSPLWLVFLLGMIGFGFRFSKGKSRR